MYSKLFMRGPEPVKVVKMTNPTSWSENRSGPNYPMGRGNSDQGV